MTDQVLLSIKGLQFAEGEDQDQVEIVTIGKYFQKDGRHYIRYDEVAEGYDGKTNSLIKINDTGVEVIKKGVTNVHMVFEENKKNLTYYDTPFGNLLVGIAATNIDVKEDVEDIRVKVEYALEINYEHLADCTISMNIKSKNAKDFKLQ